MLVLYLALVVFCKALRRKSYRIAWAAAAAFCYDVTFALTFLPSLADYSGALMIAERLFFLVMAGLLVWAASEGKGAA